MPSNTVTRCAHAKLNLALAVGPPEGEGSDRPGWHRIASWFCAIGLADDVRIRRLADGDAPTWSFACADDAPRFIATDWPLATDLTRRAHALLEHETGRTLPAAFTITKRIPAGGGLGGGSSDAAAAMLALNDLFTLGLTTEDLRALSARIGSDVAFFIDDADPPRPALVTGFADEIERTPPLRAGVVLILPPFGCATPPVYRAFDARSTGPLRTGEVAALARAARPDPDALYNDLAEPAFTLYPRLRELRTRAAAALERPVHLTGSGSALFTLCDTEEAPALAARAGSSLPGVTVHHTTTLG